jgi:hypothetical protein
VRSASADRGRPDRLSAQTPVRESRVSGPRSGEKGASGLTSVRISAETAEGADHSLADDPSGGLRSAAPVQQSHRFRTEPQDDTPSGARSTRLPTTTLRMSHPRRENELSVPSALRTGPNATDRASLSSERRPDSSLHDEKVGHSPRSPADGGTSIAFYTCANLERCRRRPRGHAQVPWAARSAPSGCSSHPHPAPTRHPIRRFAPEALSATHGARCQNQICTLSCQPGIASGAAAAADS